MYTSRPQGYPAFIQRNAREGEARPASLLVGEDDEIRASLGDRLTERGYLAMATRSSVGARIVGPRLSWFPSWTGQGTEPASGWRVDGDEGVSAVDGAAES